jgi:hypothetical protein
MRSIAFSNSKLPVNFAIFDSTFSIFYSPVFVFILFVFFFSLLLPLSLPPTYSHHHLPSLLPPPPIFTPHPPFLTPLPILVAGEGSGMDQG